MTEGPAAWLAYPVIFFAGMLVADLLRVWTGEPNMTVLVLLLAIYVLLAFPGQMTARLSHFDPLPVSRRVLFAALVLPSLVVLILGYGAGKIAVAALDEPRDLVELAEWEQGYYVRVPARYLEIAWDGRPPTFIAPWGERVEPALLPLFRGSRLGLYSPFPVTAESSPQLFAFQIRRAVEAVYGRTIPEAEIRERYLDLDGEGRVVPRGPEMSLLADHPGLEPRDNGPTLPVLLLLVVPPWLFLFSVLLRTYRDGVKSWARPTVFSGLVAFVFALMMLQLALAVADFAEPWVSRGFLEIVIRRCGETWLGSLATWAVSTLVLLSS